ncbi:hypothetical protein R1flu_011658 [Riccia fluitans]|uniref:Uncharacterized protein n=1 Tax=Riccia fluitans TaxID=41844 RepID=A0ABD1Z8T2_9MARC
MKRDRRWERTAKTYTWNAGVSSKRPGTTRTWRAGIITTGATAKPDRPGRIITARIVWSGAVHTSEDANLHQIDPTWQLNRGWE